MRLVIQHPHAAGEISGVLTSINEVVPELLARPGLDVRLISTRERSAREQLAAVRWADAVMLNSNSLLMALLARLLLKPTVLKLHYLQYQTVHWDYVPMDFRRRIARELRHLLGLRTGPRYIAESVGRLCLRTLVALIVNRVCACSRFCAEQSALPRPVAVLRNPIRIEPGLPRRMRADLDLPHRLVFIGRVTRDKGWDTLLEAATLLAGSGRRPRIDVVGDGDDLPLMRRQVAARGLGDLFHFAGRLDPGAAQARLEGALAAVMPSRFQEPAGYIPLESAARRVVSIVARVGGLPETAGPHCPTHAAGSATELADAIARLLDDPDAALAAGHAAYLRACEDYSPRRIADQLLRLIDGRASLRPVD
jgi:glycosyltransferase involved in cell wall biosynthesis